MRVATTIEHPRLKTIDVASIRIFLRLYDQYGPKVN